MKRIFASLLFLLSTAALAATTVPPQLISPTGSTTGQAVLSNGPSSAPTWQSIPLLSGAVFTGAITPSQTAGIVGTTTNNNANSGSVGEYISSTVLVGSAVSLTTGTAANVTSISLTAGDWDVSGTVAFNPAGTTTTTAQGGAISTTSATIPVSPYAGGGFFVAPVSTAGLATNAYATGTTRLSLSATTTVYLVAYAQFATSTETAYGFIGARRVR